MSLPTFDDGTMQFGSQKAIITSPANTNLGNFIFETISMDADSDVTTSKDEAGRANKHHAVGTPMQGSATLQLAALTTAAPPRFSAFSLFPHGANTANASEAVPFWIKKTGQPSEQSGEKKVTIDFIEKLN